jgi:hypothetical protein
MKSSTTHDVAKLLGLSEAPAGRQDGGGRCAI